MTEKRFTISPTDVLCMTIIDNETGKKYGSAKDIAYWMNELNDENEQLKKDNKSLMDKMFEMRTNNALDRTEISKQHYSVNEFLEDLEKW